MANLDGFDANNVDPSVGFDPVPAGKYTAVIVESEMKQTKNGKGRYLEFKYQVVDGPHKGRNLWSRHNLFNANETAVKIAQAELSAICRAVGVMRPKDSIELHNLPLTLTVALKKREDTGELTNEIKGYENKSAAAQPVAANGTGKAPWER